MRPILVVVSHKLAEDQRQVLLVQYDEVVQAPSAQRPDDALDDRVRTRRPNWGSDGVDTDAPRMLPKIAAVDSISISK
jgi:hypothetical protein